jgi:hypothetical protein
MAYCTEEAWKTAKEEVAFVKKYHRQWGDCEIWEAEEAQEVSSHTLYAPYAISPQH